MVDNIQGAVSSSLSAGSSFMSNIGSFLSANGNSISTAGSSICATSSYMRVDGSCMRAGDSWMSAGGSWMSAGGSWMSADDCWMSTDGSWNGHQAVYSLCNWFKVSDNALSAHPFYSLLSDMVCVHYFYSRKFNTGFKISENNKNDHYGRQNTFCPGTTYPQWHHGD